MKRLIDIFFSGVGLFLLLPIFLGIAGVIWIIEGRPILFRQERIGLRGSPFQILKFRTMVHNAQQLGASITVGRDPRITKIGHLLRKTKLDELPQLINVLRGEMSLVGPRPEVAHYVNMYDREQQAVLQLKPGITDPASLRYFDESQLLAEVASAEDFYINEVMPEKIRLNLEYAKSATVRTDMAVVIKTIKRLAA